MIELPSKAGAWDHFGRAERRDDDQNQQSGAKRNDQISTKHLPHPRYSETIDTKGC
jgi:hypothetical protein